MSEYENNSKMSKDQKKKAIIWGIAFVIVAVIVINFYPKISYLLPWNTSVVKCRMTVTAATQQEAFDQGDNILIATVNTITPNQYDATLGVVYSLVSLDVKEVLRGDSEEIGAKINTLQFGGKYRNTTYTYPETINYERGEEYVIIMNSNFNPAGEPYGKLLLQGDKYYSFDQFSYTIEQIREMVSQNAE